MQNPFQFIPYDPPLNLNIHVYVYNIKNKCRLIKNTLSHRVLYTQLFSPYFPLLQHQKIKLFQEKTFKTIQPQQIQHTIHNILAKSFKNIAMIFFSNSN